MARLRSANQTAVLNARLSGQADRDAAAVSRTAYKARQEAIDQVRLSMARLRAGFDDGLISERAYHSENQKLIATVRRMGETAGYSTGQLKQLAQMHGTLAREGNSIAGVVNPAGLSGNVASALQGTLPGLLQGLRGITALSPSLGAAAARVTGIAQALQTVTVAAQGTAPQLLTVGRGTNTAAQAAGFLQNGAGAASGAVRVLGGTATVAGAAVGVLASAVIGGALAANKAVNEYTAYEYQLAKISTLTERTGGELGSVGLAIKQLSRETGATMQDLSESVYDVLGASVKGADDFSQSMKLVRVAAEVAEAGFTETAVATDVLTSVINAYKLSASDAGMVADKLFRTVDVGKISFRELATSLGMVTSFAATAGVSLDEVLGAIAAMTANGVQGGQAIEYLRTMLGNMVAPSIQARKLAHDLNLEYGEQALKAKGIAGVLRDVEKATGGSAGQLKILLGDIGAVAAASAIATGNFERMDSSVRAVGDSAGSAETAYKKVADTAQKTSERVAASWKTLWTSVGELFAPLKNEVMTGVEQMLGGVNELIEKINLARKPAKAAANVADLEAQLAAQREYLAGGQKIIANPGTSNSQRRLAEDWQNRRLPNTLNRIRELEQQIAEAKQLQAQAEKDLLDYNIKNGVSNLGPNVQGPRLGGTPQVNVGPVTVTGKDLVSLLGMGGQRVLNEFGVSGKNYHHDGAVSANATHNGIDYGAPRGTPILAPFSGTLTTREDRKNGKVFELVDALGNKIVGIHLNNFSKDVLAALDAGGGKALIGQGTVLGGVGNTGTTAGSFPHLHLMGYRAGSSTPVAATSIQYQGVGSPDYGVDGSKALPTPTGTGGGSNKPAPMVTAEQIARAQQLTAALDQAQEAAKKSPKNIALTQAVIVATREMEKFKKASSTNAEALAAIQKEGAKAGGTYIATAKDLQTYGATALRLVKDLEAAEASGDPARKARVDQRIAAWQGESEVRKAVFGAEGAAYRTRQQTRERDKAEQERAAREQEQDNKKNHDKAVQRQRELGQRQARLAEALRQGRIQDAQLEVTGIVALRDQELKEAEGNAAKKLAVEKKYAEQVRKAQRAVAQTQFADAKRDAENAADGTTQGTIARARKTLKQAQDNADRDARNRVQDATRVVQEETTKQGEAVTDLARKYDDARTSLNKKAEAGTLMAEDMADYARQLADYWGEAGRAGIKARPEIEKAHAAAKAFAATALQVNGAAIGRQIFEPVADGSSLARQAANEVRIGLSDLLKILPEGAEETAAFVEVMTDLDRQGKLAMNTLKDLNEVIAARAAARQGDLDGYEVLQTVLANPADYADGGGQGGPDVSKQVEQNYRDFAVTVDQLTASDLDNAESMRLVEEAFTGAAQKGAITERQLQSLIDKLHHLKAAADLVAQRDALMGSPVGVVTGNARPDEDSGDPLAMTPEEAAKARAAYDEMVAGLGDLDDAQLAVQLSMARLTKDADLENKVLAVQNQRLQANKDALRDLPALMAQLDLNALEREHGTGILDEAWYIGERERLETIKENADWEVQKKGLTGQALENAEQLHQDRLRDIVAKGVNDRARIEDDRLADVADAQANETTGNLLKLTESFQKGAIGQKDFTDQAVAALPNLDKLARAAERAGRTDLAAYYRDLAAGLRETGGEALKTAEKFARLSGGQGAMNDARGGVAGLVAGDRRDFDAGWQQQVDAMNEAKLLYPELAKDFDRIIAKGRVFKNLNLAHSFLNDAKLIVQGVGQVARALGNDQLTEAASQFESGFESAQTAVVGIAKVMANPADVGGWMQAITGVVGAIDGVGNAVMALDPAYQKWKKNQLEIAALEREGMGQKSYNNWLENPYYDTLQQDAANREKTANAGFFQKLGWSIFGNAPEVMSDEAAKAKAKAGKVFADFASDLTSTAEQALLEGWESGDFSNVADKMGAQLNRFVARLAIQTVFAKSNLSKLVESLAEEVARGGDTSDEEAALRAEMGRVSADAQAALSVVDGFGSGADSSSAAASASSPVTGASFYVANSSKIDLFDDAITRADAMYLRHEAVLARHDDVLTRHTDMLDRLLREGIRLIDSEGNLRGALR